jgi:20S proteasome subunit beta 4
MDHLVGLVGKDFVLIAADRKVAFSVISVKTDQDKIMNFDKSKLLAVSGEVRTSPFLVCA